MGDRSPRILEDSLPGTRRGPGRGEVEQGECRAGSACRLAPPEEQSREIRPIARWARPPPPPVHWSDELRPAGDGACLQRPCDPLMRSGRRRDGPSRCLTAVSMVGAWDESQSLNLDLFCQLPAPAGERVTVGHPGRTYANLAAIAPPPRSAVPSAPAVLKVRGLARASETMSRSNCSLVRGGSIHR